MHKNELRNEQIYILLCEEKSFDDTNFTYVTVAQYFRLDDGSDFWYDVETDGRISNEYIRKILVMPTEHSTIWAIAEDYPLSED